MISYKDYIELMERRGYVYNGPITINESNPNIKTFQIKSRSTGKILELECPKNTIISACGNTHEGGCPNSYSINIQYLNDNNDEPFQNLHYPTKITDSYYVIAELIVTKILTKEPDKNDTEMQEWLEKTNPVLKTMGIENSYEYLMWHGIYKLFHKEFLNTSFNLYPNEKMVFYANNPDIDITVIKFELKVDIFEIKKYEELYVLDKNKITNMESLDYKSIVKI